MDKMREEFEAWVKSEFDIDCGSMSFGTFDGDASECYHNHTDQDGAIIVSVMLVSWQASRAALCVKLPSFDNGSLRGYGGDCEEARAVVDSVAESLEKAGVRYE